MVDVTVLGDINVDLLTFPIEEYPEKDKQIIVPSIQLNPGGSAFNIVLACSKLGIKTKFIGKIGNDIFSKYLLKVLKNNKINYKAKVSKNERTGITLGISFRDETRSMISFKGTNETFSIKDFDIKEIKGKIFIISGFNLLNSLRKDVVDLIQYAKRNGMKTGLDPNWDPEGWTENRLKDIYDVLKVVDWFFPDLEEGKAITFTDKDVLIVKKLIHLGPKIVCLKMGDKGCLIGDKDKIELVKTFDVKPINPTGAGDIFLAAFIKGYLSGYSLNDIVTFANAAGALSTTKTGLERYPTYKEVIKFIEEKMR